MSVIASDQIDDWVGAHMPKCSHRQQRQVCSHEVQFHCVGCEAVVTRIGQLVAANRGFLCTACQELYTSS